MRAKYVLSREAVFVYDNPYFFRPENKPLGRTFGTRPEKEQA